MNGRLGPAAPAPSSPETEALRRFRTYSATALTRGTAPPPNLDGLRVNQRRVSALLEAWTECATLLAGADGDSVSQALQPLADEFRLALRSSQNGRKASGRPRSARRAVVSAIDRVPDAFLAIDTDSGQIEDANPAAGALLGVQRDALLGVDALSFVPKARHGELWGQLDAVSEGNENHRATLTFIDVNGVSLQMEASLTAFSTRSRTLALILLRRSPEALAERSIRLVDSTPATASV